MEGSDLESALKVFSTDLDGAVIPALTKNKFREHFAKLRLAHLEMEKQRVAELTRQAGELVKQHVANEPDAKFLVLNLKVDGIGKAMTQALTEAKKLGKAAMVLSVDKTGKVAFSCIVPKDINAKFTAQEWAGVAAQTLDGKKGGKDETAQGVGSRTDKVDEAARLAQDFAKLKF
jgi:alanyl-tRNA synthetase